ncbi:Murein DD-endopeptidase MepM and murein hydrolase activator NlpD, contain LysM domain [Brevinema andersonii]|uniref:Murein DD-endopeptidase MepM and murein hydrolase activator NlpD, contain LysM domain n=1 Tax=Brevinema andersonii TaxID=34097 RepID=A0A1I1DFZ5_BREAD|nr:M23 family metallopeptidase [Brevinema andersonii]SFB73764.1 Murein DD-endopeptidase MepM and murein hydrolase activator NlpD, contain LysM domain [Brevinema andersonii]
MKKYFLLWLMIPQLIFSYNVNITLDKLAKIKTFDWNGKTPLSLDNDSASLYTFVLVNGEEEIPFVKSSGTNADQKNITFSPIVGLTNLSPRAYLKVSNRQKKWPFNVRQIKVIWQTNIPKLEIISLSETVTHGGSGLMVVKSEPVSNLAMLAFIDENNTEFYPNIFKKDGYYIILFPWYSDNSSDWSNNSLFVMDKAGNTNVLIPDIRAKKRTYVQKKIILPENYGQQKAKELNLPEEEAKKLEGNIVAINAVLAKQKSFDRWNGTRKTFQENIKYKISDIDMFSNHALPFRNYVVTAGYGDKRNYFFRNKQVRSSTHRGKDMASTKNSPVYALLDGTVVYADWNRGNGKTIVLDHGLGVYTFYAHNEKISTKPGDKVNAGQQIAVSGTTGQSTGDHLHLSVIVQGMYVDPKEWLSKDSIRKLFLQPMWDAALIIE